MEKAEALSGHHCRASRHTHQLRPSLSRGPVPVLCRCCQLLPWHLAQPRAVGVAWSAVHRAAV